MPDANFAAIDLGAESGRVILARVNDQRIELNEMHRFPNGPVRTIDELHWDTLRLWSEMKEGVAKAAAEAGELSGIGVDTWGVDFGLLAGDTLLGNPFHYRDARTNGMLDKAFEIVPRAEIYQHTGLQFMQFNTVFQLLSMKLSNAPLLEMAETMLLMPDLFHYWWTGRKCCEFTNATTTQAFDPRKGAWSTELLGKLGLPSSIFPEIVQPGTVLGNVRDDIRGELQIGDVPVIAPATHDTGAAVAAIPATTGRNWAFLSSGTWSLMGAEVNDPIVTDKALEYNFTNEGGVYGTYRFLKNIMGLWLVQECRRTWQREGRDYSYTDLTDMAARAQPFAALINPDDPSFLAPGDMPMRIESFCDKTGQTLPAEPGAMVRACLESLALTYRQKIAQIEECTGRKIEVIQVVGGGIQNEHLCQWTADSTGRPVLAGPVEATALGNVVVQSIATGVLPDIKTARQVVSRSVEVKTYEPKDTARWDEAYAKFEKIQ